MKSKLKDSSSDDLGAMRSLMKVIEAGSFSAVAKESLVSISTVARKI
ncbi:LysR family transcriptional regulator [Pseudomonas sp. Marseille-Q5117]|nr:hypothetical protein [Pseudomonas sp. Marseille-Q5117]